MVTPYFYPHVGGLEKYVLNLSKTLIKHKHEVIVISSLEGSQKRIENIDGIKVYRLGYDYPIKNVAYLNVHNFTKYKNILNSCDIINVHGHLFQTTTMTILMKMLGMIKKPVVITLHGSFVPYKKFILNLLEKTLGSTIGKFNLSNADKIIAISKSVRKNVCKDDPKSIVIYDGINLKEFEGQNKKLNLRKEYKIPKDKKIILFIGRFYWHKGISLATEAMKEIQKTIKCVFVAVGDGPLRKSTEKYCRENGIENIFTGFRNDIYNIMKSSDILLFPSLSEGFGIALLEAMASSLPIVATNVGSIPEIIKDNYNGILVPVNSKRIADAAVKILENENLRKRFEKNGRNYVKKYDWNIVAEKIERLFRSMI